MTETVTYDEVLEDQPLHLPTEAEEAETRAVRKTLREINETLTRLGIEYYIVGSTARMVYMGLPPYRNEVDIVIPDKRAQALETLKELKIKYPQVDDDLSSLFSKDPEGQYTLSKGRVRLAIPEELMRPEWLTLDDTRFSTLPPHTLLHTFLINGRPFRPKDRKYSFIFAEWLRRLGSYDHSKYEVFHDFARIQYKAPLGRVRIAYRGFLSALPEEQRGLLQKILYTHGPSEYIGALFNLIDTSLCGFGPRPRKYNHPAAQDSAKQDQED